MTTDSPRPSDAADCSRSLHQSVKVWTEVEALAFIEHDTRISFAHNFGWWLIFDGRVIHNSTFEISDGWVASPPPDHVKKDLAKIFCHELQIAVIESERDALRSCADLLACRLQCHRHDMLAGEDITWEEGDQNALNRYANIPENREPSGR